MVPRSYRVLAAFPREHESEPKFRSHPTVSQQIRSLADAGVLRNEDARSPFGGVASVADHDIDKCPATSRNGDSGSGAASILDYVHQSQRVELGTEHRGRNIQQLVRLDARQVPVETTHRIRKQ